MQEPGGYYDNVRYVPERVNNNNPCSTSDVDMATVQVDVDMATVQVDVDMAKVQVDVDMAKVQGDCLDAIALQLLLKLKRHLKVVYSLDDARCQAFSLNEPPKSGEAFSRQNVPFNIGNTNISLPSCLQDVASVYQDFKTALREDSMDFAVFIPSVQTRKRPTPRSTTNPTPRSTTRVRRTAAPSVTKPRAGARGDDSDDDDWTGGPRMLDFSGGGRVTRQRVQV